MRISVIYVGLWGSWSTVWELLEQAKQAGVTYTAYDYFTTTVQEMKKAEDCDGYIYLDIYPSDQTKPFAWIFEDDTEAAIVQKIQDFAKHIREGHVQKIPESFVNGEKAEEVIPNDRAGSDDVRCGDNCDAITDSHGDSVADGDTGMLCVEVPKSNFEVTEDEIGRLCFKSLSVEVDGQEVTLSTQDIVTLSKMYRVMREFGYKIKKLIL